MSGECTPILQARSEACLRGQYEKLIASGQPGWAFVTLKVKRFAFINRVLGRQAGDEILAGIYRVMEAWIAPEESAAWCYAGCFSLLLYLPTIDTIHQRTISLIRTVRGQADPRVQDRLFVGVGVYPLQKEPVNFDIAQHNANLSRQGSQQASYRNSHYEIYGYSWHDPNERFLDLNEMVLPAIEQGHFKMFLQPKVDLKTGMITKAEALVRWIDPVKGMILPGDFIGGLEENGLIRLVDRFIFEQACAKLHRWRHTFGKEFQISVNLSKSYFEDQDLIQEYREIFERYDIPKDSIEIELLESIILNQVEHVCSVVDNINAYGFQCSLDDFGSGFASFSVLSNTNLACLKMDRSLFMDASNAKERIVVSNIIHTAHELQLKTVAEGVETADYVRLLYNLGCDSIQGYVFYRPMPADEFEARFVVGDERITLKDYFV